MPLACSVSPGVVPVAEEPRCRHPYWKYGNPLHRNGCSKSQNPSAVSTAVDDVLGHEGELAFDGGDGLIIG